jgi:polysaccharide biosynthesis protein PelF
MPAQPRRVLFVFAWLVVGGEETEVRLLARHLDPRRYTISVVGCFRKPGMPEQTHTQLAALGVEVDKTPYQLSFEDTVAYLAAKIPAYDLVVACQAVPDVVPALERIAAQGVPPPPLIEHGGLVQEATRGPKHRTARYVGVCRSIRDAAAGVMPERPHHALEIPSMVDLSECDPGQRAAVRAELHVADGEMLVGWVGRLDRKKRVEDFLRAAALVHVQRPETRFVVVGGLDAFMPEYADELHVLAHKLAIAERLIWTGDCPNVPRLLTGFDIFVWLSRGEGMPHVIAEAGAAALPVVATCDNGTAQQITHGETGLFVPHANPAAAARAIGTLCADAALRRTLGRALRRKVAEEYSAGVVVERWQALFDEVIREAASPDAATL